MSFCTVINCMDGRTQLPVNEYLRKLLSVDYVDTVTEAGPVRILADENDSLPVESIFNRVDISVNKHKSSFVAIVAHYDCAGNPLSKDKQLIQLKDAMEFLERKYPGLKILGLWINSDWIVEQV